ncbi:hypothetical protein MAR_027180 [Mya arenaria]|uniref:Uncharacterized protein n=1 Tax=Mya arenaria TaxID=6604 RepID=A0ABY7EUM8_MYAAR|nr:hypothetical protein MAR_027180 [Mya arenaria]
MGGLDGYRGGQEAVYVFDDFDVYTHNATTVLTIFEAVKQCKICIQDTPDFLTSGSKPGKKQPDTPNSLSITDLKSKESLLLPCMKRNVCLANAIKYVYGTVLDANDHSQASSTQETREKPQTSTLGHILQNNFGNFGDKNRFVKDRCNAKMDIVLVLDASSSLQLLEFTLMKGFLINTISQLAYCHFSALTEATTDQEAVTTQVANKVQSKRKRDYSSYDEETRAKIARYAIDNGLAKAARRFTSDLNRKVSETTVRSMRDSYVKLKKTLGEEPTVLAHTHHGAPPPCWDSMTRPALNPPRAPVEKSLAMSIVRRMGFVKRKGTKATKTLPADFEDIKDTFVCLRQLPVCDISHLFGSPQP